MSGSIAARSSSVITHGFWDPYRERDLLTRLEHRHKWLAHINYRWAILIAFFTIVFLSLTPSWCTQIFLYFICTTLSKMWSNILVNGDNYVSLMVQVLYIIKFQCSTNVRGDLQRDQDQLSLIGFGITPGTWSPCKTKTVTLLALSFLSYKVSNTIMVFYGNSFQGGTVVTHHVGVFQL
jgi:hypothetical protein